MNRGSAKYRDERIRAARRFNEAPIHESGKYRLPVSALRSLYSFNEAPIHESGK